MEGSIEGFLEGRIEGFLEGAVGAMDGFLEGFTMDSAALGFMDGELIVLVVGDIVGFAVEGLALGDIVGFAIEGPIAPLILLTGVLPVVGVKTEILIIPS